MQIVDILSYVVPGVLLFAWVSIVVLFGVVGRKRVPPDIQMLPKRKD